MEISSVLLSGGGSEIQGMEDVLSEDLEVPVHCVELSQSLTNIGADRRFAIAYMLGRYAIGEVQGRHFDMRVDEFSYQGNLSALRKYSKALSVAAVILTLGGGALFVSKVLVFLKFLKAMEGLESSGSLVGIILPLYLGLH